MATSKSKKRGSILYHLTLAVMFAGFVILALDAKAETVDGGVLRDTVYQEI